MSSAGVTYFLGVFFWALTALYGVLSSQDFIQEQFLAPRLFTPLTVFTDWHAVIGTLVLGAWCAARRVWTEPSAGRTQATAVTWLAALVLLLVVMPLSGRHTSSAALLIVGLGVSVIVLLALTELRGVNETSENPPPDRSRADLTACLMAAAGMTLVHAGASTWLDGVSAALASDVLQSLRLHLLLGGGTFLTIAAVRGAAGMTSRPLLAVRVLSGGALATVLATFVSTVFLASISVRGPLAIGVGLGLGVALACAVVARGVASDSGGDGVVGAFSALSPRLTARWWAFALWLACLLFLVVAVITASRAMDWNFVLLRTGIAVSWLLALSSALTFSRRFSNGGAGVSYAIALLILGVHVALQSAAAPVQASSLHSASGKWLAEMLEGDAGAEGMSELVGFLHQRTNIPRDTHVEAVDLQLAQLTGPPAAVRPHVFVLVVDSLRRDYLAPYNAAVTFTPAIAALAQDSLVFRNAFTQYGATGLSVPSIWVGGPILHKQYVTSFPRMNTLAKLLEHEQYAQWIGMDNIMDVILPPSANRERLDAAIAVKDFRLCRTLAEVRSRLAERAPSAAPVFVYSLPQDLHVSVVTREGAQSLDEGDYGSFYAPVASRVRRLDQCLGEFVSDLKARGLYEQSVIILTSDHGDSLGEGGRMGHAYSLHPEIVRVPLIVHVPPALRNAWTWDETGPAYSTDITPTLYRLLGHEPAAPASFFGEPLARHPGQPSPARRARMVAASYGAVYGALLANATRYYVFDAIAMREMAFEFGDGLAPTSTAVTADVRQQGLAVIRDTVNGISTLYRFPETPLQLTARDSGP
jgi:arylsulfatase A-like enzyme